MFKAASQELIEDEVDENDFAGDDDNASAAASVAAARGSCNSQPSALGKEHDKFRGELSSLCEEALSLPWRDHGDDKDAAPSEYKGGIGAPLVTILHGKRKPRSRELTDLLNHVIELSKSPMKTARSLCEHVKELATAPEGGKAKGGKKKDASTPPAKRVAGRLCMVDHKAILACCPFLMRHLTEKMSREAKRYAENRHDDEGEDLDEEHRRKRADQLRSASKKLSNITSALQSLVDATKSESMKKQLLVSTLRGGSKFVVAFLAGIDLFQELVFTSDLRKETLKSLESMQKSTRQMQHLCAYAKAERDRTLVKEAPALKKQLEKVLYQMKAISEMAKSKSVSMNFTVGKLKPRTVSGKQIKKDVLVQEMQVSES
jgi:hypothetical protein